MFKGGTTKMLKRCEKILRFRRKGRRVSKHYNSIPNGSLLCSIFCHEIQLNPEIARLDGNIASVTASPKEVYAKVCCIEETVKRVMGTMLDTFKEEVLHKSVPMSSKGFNLFLIFGNCSELKQNSNVCWSRLLRSFIFLHLDYILIVSDFANKSSSGKNLLQVTTQENRILCCANVASDNKTRNQEPRSCNVVYAHDKILTNTTHPSLPLINQTRTGCK
ncbi:hypothetical protein YC2023_021375 [Brassica napus]